jgi:predicted TIM-barrel fold metal-dependent hydrolase
MFPRNKQCLSIWIDIERYPIPITTKKRTRLFMIGNKPFLFFLIILFIIPLLTGCPVVDKICGASGKDPAKFFSEASPQAHALVEAAWRDFGDQPAFDFHVHALGDDEKGNGTFINPSSKTILRVTHYLRLKAYLNAGKVKDKKLVDEQYTAHLVKLARNMGHPVRLHLLAFDKYYDRQGNAVIANTEFYVPNNYVVRLSRAYPDIFVPVISVHPYRKDAIAELEKWAKEGVRMVKWIPNVQGINPADDAITPFYQAMKKLGMTLLVHSGEEIALDSHGQQYLGNPLLLRKPLDCGVKVIVAHCASAGKNVDLDRPGRIKVHNFDLFMRLFDDKKYEGLLFADISGIMQFNRMDKTLPVLLARTDLHSRMVNGSDYPLPAVNVLIQTGKYAAKGYIKKEDQKALKEIYEYNPLLFEFVLKRIIRLPKTGQGFSTDLFRNNPVSVDRPTASAGTT